MARRMPRLLGLDGALLDPATDERRLMTDEVKQLHDIVNSSESDEQAKEEAADRLDRLAARDSRRVYRFVSLAFPAVIAVALLLLVLRAFCSIPLLTLGHGLVWLGERGVWAGNWLVWSGGGVSSMSCSATPGQGRRA